MTNVNLRVGIIQLNVTDLEEAWRFYVDKLGLRGMRNMGPGNPFELALGSGTPIVLVYSVPRMVKRDYPNETGITLVFYTDDIRSTVAEWKERGVPFISIQWSRDDSGIADTPFGPFIAFQDPFGNVHELLEPRRQER